ncbi:FadR/GntR family transcriptional regulator [Actinomycetaceae bacterium L2_0104]
MPSTRVTDATNLLLESILDGTFDTDSPLPAEVDLAAFLNVSRPTMREAVRDLATRGVLRVVHGRGTFIRPVSEWTDFATLTLAMTRSYSERQLGLQLSEVRLIIEVGAAGLAALKHSEEELIQIQEHLDAFDIGCQRNDVEKIAEADRAFHNIILRASGNPFLESLMQPLQDTLVYPRRRMGMNERIRNRVRSHHFAIRRAIASGNDRAAEAAMRAHLEQARNDLVLDLPDTPPNR